MAVSGQFLTGEIAALTAALFWAVASISFAEIGRHVQATHLNLLKGFLAISLMSMVLVVGTLFGADHIAMASINAISPMGWLLLTTSGLVGIAIGDSAYFACLRRIGPQKGLMLESTAPVLTALLALLLYREYLSPLAWGGIALTSVGVIVVVRFSIGAAHYRNSPAGIIFGILASAGQALGIVLSRMALDGEDIEPLAGGLVRLCAGLAGLSLWLMLPRFFGRTSCHPASLVTSARLLYERNLLPKLFIAMFIGTFLTIWLQQLAVKFTSAGVAQALFAACPLIGMLLAVRQGHRQPAMVWFGLLVGLGGIILLLHPCIS